MMELDFTLLQSPVVLAAIFLVLAAVAFLAWLLTREHRPRGGGRQRRLRILEVAALDPKHRLVLVRRDETEHLVLIGPAAALVVETGIRPPLPPVAPDLSPQLFVPRDRES
jgi:flagellar protein FliO/FliZ